jgi:BirA family biotin operon repressor/biotin-[acetyl-CoA-carboxylase] ligase
MPVRATASGSGAPVRRYEEIDSTNAEALRLAMMGEPAPFWVSARVQTAGRGRSGRSWTSSPGNLIASLAIELETDARKAYQLSLVTGVAVAEAVASALPAEAAKNLRLKWPNDILIGSAKAGGILVESAARPGRGGLVGAIGIGLNLVDHPRGLGRDATHLAAHGWTSSPEEMLLSLDVALGRWLANWNEGAGFGQVREAWLERGGMLGERVSVNAGSTLICGTYCGLDEDGALLLSDEDGTIRRIHFGDVSLAG